MTALWARGNSFGDGLGGCIIGDGAGDSYSDDDNDGDGYGDGDGDGYGIDDDDGVFNGDGGSAGGDFGGSFGYPEQDYDGCTAIGRMLVYEAVLPVADLLVLAVAR